MRRELAIVLASPLTWLVAAVAAVLVGHGFVLAVDLFSASSRSALANALQSREMDPLAGVVRPTLGGADLAISLFGPLVAARPLSIEKERRTFGALCILEGSSTSVVTKKLVAAALAAATLLVGPIVVFAAYALGGGHLDAIETAVALTGEVLHVVLVATVSVAAAAWTRTLAQAATLGVVVSLTSWAIDAADGFAALAWLGGASAWSIERRLEPFQRGIVSAGSFAWLGIASAAATLLAFTGARFDASRSRRAGIAALVFLCAAALLAGAGRIRRGYDWSEQRRSSLPEGVVSALRALRQPIGIDVWLDRDDSRRRQLESDVISKLTLARPDVVVRMPLDRDPTAGAGSRDEDYGEIRIQVGAGQKITRSTSRRELITLVFDAAGVVAPAWESQQYSGFPCVVDGSRRSVLVVLSYVGLPGMLFAASYWLTRRSSVR